MIFIYLCRHISGRLAEWLGSGLQNRPQRFDSARNLFTRFFPERVFLFASGIQQILTDQYQHHGEGAAQQYPDKGCYKLAEPENFQVEKGNMVN